MMSDPALQRTVRRCTAVLAIPLSLYPMVFVSRLETDGYPYMSLTLELADELALMVLFGAVAYLVASVWQAQRSRSGSGGEQTAT